MWKYVWCKLVSTKDWCLKRKTTDNQLEKENEKKASKARKEETKKVSEECFHDIEKMAEQ